jgi:hypothetical protein
VAPLVEAHDAVARRERRDLRLPVSLAGAEAMNKEDR